MQSLEVFDPSGATEITQLHAPRLDTLEGKTVALLSDDMWQAHRILPMIRAHLEETYSGITVLSETEFPMGTRAIDSEEAVERIVAAGADAVVVGNAA